MIRASTQFRTGPAPAATTNPCGDGAAWMPPGDACRAPDLVGSIKTKEP